MFDRLFAPLLALFALMLAQLFLLFARHDPAAHFELPDRRQRGGFLRILGVVAVLFFAGGALAAGDEAKPAGVDLLQQLAIHAAGIAIFIRGVIALLRSPFAFAVWGRVPEPARVAILLGLGAVAVAFDHVALGTPLLEAFAGAFVGLTGVVGGHEMSKRVVNRKPTTR